MFVEFRTAVLTNITNTSYTPTNSGNVTSPDTHAVLKVFIINVPFMLICATVFIIFTCLWDRLKVYGWIVIATSVSYFTRSLVTAVRDLEIHLAGWNIIMEAPKFCVFLGKPTTT